jgi:hydroxymethylglutaryl-CoA lyase
MTQTRCSIVEVSPRDGLQNERAEVSTALKIELIDRAERSGVGRIEVASFVNPARVPQMADAEAVIAGLKGQAFYVGLVLNMKGAERAAKTSVHEFGCVAIASDTFGRKNQGQTSAESVLEARRILRFARSEGRRGNVTISAAWGCPFEGEIDPSRVVSMAVDLAGEAPVDIAIADTIGVADPWRVEELFLRLHDALPSVSFRGHFHNTRNTGLANAYAAVKAGVRTLDGSISGIGGCPFAPAATGNIPTEDLLYMLSRAGFDTGVDLAAACETAQWLEGVIGRKTPGLVSKAGLFPRVQEKSVA